VPERVFVPWLLDPLDHVLPFAVAQLVAHVELLVVPAHARAAVLVVHEVAQPPCLPVPHRSSVPGPNGEADSTASGAKMAWVSEQDFISEYLESLPPDQRGEQARAFEESALLRLAAERTMKLAPEDQKVLMAEFDVYAETGEVEDGSLFADLLRQAEGVEYDEALGRRRVARGRSSLIRFLARAGYEASSLRQFEESYSLVEPLDQVFVKLMLDFIGQIRLLAEEGADEFVSRLTEEGQGAFRDRRQAIGRSRPRRSS